jgi:hypothetical protein
MRKLAACLAFMMVPINAAADKHIPLWGAGLQTCAAYLSDTATISESTYRTSEWVWGYLSARNQDIMIAHGSAKHLLSSTDELGVLRWLERWCSANRTAQLASGLTVLAAVLEARMVANDEFGPFSDALAPSTRQE